MKSICESLVKCTKCKKVVKRNIVRPESHNFGLVRCTVCQKYVNSETHRCHDEAENEHVFQGENTKDDFCEWLFQKENAGSIVIAHDFQGYDGYFILQFLHKNGIVPVIMRGAKLLRIYVPMLNIKFIDSLCFIPMKLANFPKTFGITELTKGYFPHLFSRTENQKYIGPIPPSAYYFPTEWVPARKSEEFLSWHKSLQQSNYVFNFQDGILKYCRLDVDILRRCCIDFCQLFRSVTDIDPFEKCLTIASACDLVFRKKFLEEQTIAIIPPNSYRPSDKHSVFALKWLSFTSEQNNINIPHARNSGEKRVGNYHACWVFTKSRTLPMRCMVVFGMGAWNIIQGILSILLTVKLCMTCTRQH